MAKDPTKMSLRELQELELKVKKAKLTVQERSRTELRQELESIAAQAGFKLSVAARVARSQPNTPIRTIPPRPGADEAASRAGLPPD